METKICRECKEEKPIEEFTKHKRMKGGYDTICKKCNNSKVKKWVEKNPDKYGLKCKRWYRANITKIVEQRKKKYEDFAKHINTFKEGKSCVRCGYNKIPQILQYHHRNKNDKKFNISESINIKKIILENPEILTKEIEKCDLLCPNCHFEIHYLENKKPL